MLADLGKAPARPRQRSQIAGLRAGYTALLNLYREGESLAGDATALQRIDPTIEAVERRLKLQAGAAGLAACAVGS